MYSLARKELDCFCLNLLSLHSTSLPQNLTALKDLVDVKQGGGALTEKQLSTERAFLGKTHEHLHDKIQAKPVNSLGSISVDYVFIKNPQSLMFEFI